ncbi:hypothetical protein [Brevibacterium jeotgali]|nr:hypothetical protein [Brevibacterium jeotgali]
MPAHTCALTHWYVHAQRLSVDEYVEQKVRAVVLGVLSDAARSRVER